MNDISLEVIQSGKIYVSSSSPDNISTTITNGDVVQITIEENGSVSLNLVSQPINVTAENGDSVSITVPTQQVEVTVSSSEGGGGGLVSSVNGQVGDVVLDAGDVGADVSGSASAVQSNLNTFINTTAPVTYAPISSVHNPVAIATPSNGLSIDVNQILSVVPSSSGVTGVLSGTDWNTFNGKQNSLGFTPVDIASANWVDLTDGGSTNLHTHSGLGGVESVTGNGVNNTDPLNPVLTFPTPAEIGAQVAGSYLTSANIEDSIVDGHTTIAPSGNAVFDALAGKQPAGSYLTAESDPVFVAAVATGTGTGSLVLANTPTLITPILGVATATSINKVAITVPATSATLTIADGKTLTVNESITLTAAGASASLTLPNLAITLDGGGAAQTYTLPSVGGTFAMLNAANVYTTQQMVDGTSNQIQLRVQGHSTQTNNLQTWESSAGVELAWISGAGRIATKILEATANDQYSGQFWAESGNFARVAGLYGFTDVYNANNTQGLGNEPRAVYISTRVRLSKTAINITGLLISTAALSGSTITNDYLIRGEISAAHAGTITNFYGLYLSNISAGATLNYAIYTNAGLVHFGDSVDLASGKNLTMLAGNIITDTTTGTKIGTATGQKLGFWNATPIIQPAGATQAAPAAYVTGAFGLDSDANMQALYDLVVAMRTALVNSGIMKGAA